MTPEERRARKEYREAWARGKCEDCGAQLDRNSNRYCTDCLEAWTSTVHFAGNNRPALYPSDYFYHGFIVD